MALSEFITRTETTWLDILFEECKRNFTGIHLPSHDQIHHLRVWYCAKILLHQLSDDGVPVSETDTENLIFAVFFHDQGISKTFAKEHGRISAAMCRDFIHTSGLKISGNMNDILNAVENHDNKDYSESTGFQKFDLQKTLNIADDIDALGFLGAYRYLEIYLLRGTDIRIIPETVLQNLNSRFTNLSGVLGAGSKLVKDQNPRYRQACIFFEDLKEYLNIKNYDPGDYTGPAGVVNHIKNDLISNKLSLIKTCCHVIDTNKDPYCQAFFQNVLNEVSSIIT